MVSRYVPPGGGGEGDGGGGEGGGSGQTVTRLELPANRKLRPLLAPTWPLTLSITSNWDTESYLNVTDRAFWSGVRASGSLGLVSCPELLSN